MASDDTVYSDLLKSILAGETLTGDIHPGTVTAIAERYMQAVFGGYGKTFATVELGTPDHNMLANLEKNVYSFSAAKNYHEVVGLNELLTSNGQIRSFNEFRTEAHGLIGEYSRHTETEYNAAVGSAEMAANWVGFEKSAEDGNEVLLKYETVGDRRVRESHRLLDGVVKPMDDKFWDKYYPPNGWGCRCTVYELPTKAHITPDKAIVYPEVPKMWQVNTAKENVIFPPDSPYFNGCPPAILKEALNYLPYERRFVTAASFKNGGSLEIHAGAIEQSAEKAKQDKTSIGDWENLNEVGQDLAKAGHKVQILPTLQHDTEERKVIFPDAKEGKSPDYRIDGTLVELKALKSGKDRAIKDNLDKAANQADHVILSIPEDYNHDTFVETLKKKFRKYPGLQSVKVRNNGKYTQHLRKDYT